MRSVLPSGSDLYLTHAISFGNNEETKGLMSVQFKKKFGARKENETTMGIVWELKARVPNGREKCFAYFYC